MLVLCVCCFCTVLCFIVFFFKQKTAYEMRISDWSSDVCSSDLFAVVEPGGAGVGAGSLCIGSSRSGASPIYPAPHKINHSLRCSARRGGPFAPAGTAPVDRKNTRLNSSH